MCTEIIMKFVCLDDSGRGLSISVNSFHARKGDLEGKSYPDPRHSQPFPLFILGLGTRNASVRYHRSMKDTHPMPRGVVGGVEFGVVTRPIVLARHQSRSQQSSVSQFSISGFHGSRAKCPPQPLWNLLGAAGSNPSVSPIVPPSVLWPRELCPRSITTRSMMSILDVCKSCNCYMAYVCHHRDRSWITVALEQNLLCDWHKAEREAA